MWQRPMTVTRGMALTLLLWTAGIPGPVCAQSAPPKGQKPQPAPAGQPAPSGSGQAAAPTQPPAPSSETYTYNPEGRRDPFVSLLNRGEDFRVGGAKGQRPAGLRGLLIGEATLRGIVKTQGGFVAILQGPDNRTYIVRPNDRLFDGTVRSIAADGVVFLQEVNDPLSLIKQREVRKPLRPPQEGQ